MMASIVVTPAERMNLSAVFRITTSALIWLGVKLQGEINQSLFLPINFPQVEAGFDLADLITYPLSDNGSIGVIQDNTVFAVEPTRSFIYFGDDGIETKRKNPVLQYSLTGVEYFTLPGKVTD